MSTTTDEKGWKHAAGADAGGLAGTLVGAKGGATLGFFVAGPFGAGLGAVAGALVGALSGGRLGYGNPEKAALVALGAVAVTDGSGHSGQA